MAAWALNFLKCPANLVLSRCLQDTKLLLRVYQFSTYKSLNRKEKPPVKFTTSSAAKITIAETTGFENKVLSFKVKKIIILSSLCVFLIYFCLIREENYIDEILSMDAPKNSDELKLLDLQLKLKYCEKNKLPTKNLKDKIQELTEKNKNLISY